MRKLKMITLDEAEIAVRELTVEQVTDIMDAQQERRLDTFDMLFPDRLPADAVCLATGLDKARLNKLSPSELDAIWRAAEEVNPFFTGMVGRLAALGQAALAAGDLSVMTSKEPAAN
jgi:hypothetical protein